MKNPHTELINQSILAMVRARLGIFWENRTGAGFPVRWDKDLGEWVVVSRTVIKYGFKDSTDIIGITFGGFFFGGECKTGGAVLTPGQKRFGNMIEHHSGIHVEIREPGDGVLAIKEFLRGRL